MAEEKILKKMIDSSVAMISVKKNPNSMISFN
jgi:hypothetical protein